MRIEVQVVEQCPIRDDEAVGDALVLALAVRELHVPAFEQPDRNLLIGEDADPGMSRIDAYPVLQIAEFLVRRFDPLEEGTAAVQDHVG